MEFNESNSVRKVDSLTCNLFWHSLQLLRAGNSDYIVVGVIGGIVLLLLLGMIPSLLGPGGGKSSLLNYICGESNLVDIVAAWN